MSIDRDGYSRQSRPRCVNYVHINRTYRSPSRHLRFRRFRRCRVQSSPAIVVLTCDDSFETRARVKYKIEKYYISRARPTAKRLYRTGPIDRPPPRVFSVDPDADFITFFILSPLAIIKIARYPLQIDNAS